MGIHSMRPVGWEDRLAEYIHNTLDKPFRWGRNDCVLYARRGMLYVFNTDILTNVTLWKNKKEGMEVIKSLGGNLSKIAARHLPDQGFRRKNIRFASRGDLVITDGPNGPMFAICVGDRIVAPGAKGLEFLPIEGECWTYKGDQ